MASVKIIDTSVASGDTGGDVFDSPNGTYVKALALNTDWEYEDTQTVDGQIWYDLGGDQWISEIYAAPNITDLEVRSGTAKVAGFTTATVYYSPNGSENTQDNPTPLPENSEWAYNKAATDSEGTIWFDVGRSQWVTTQEVVDESGSGSTSEWVYPFEAPYDNADNVSGEQDFGYTRPGWSHPFHDGLDFGDVNYPHKIIAVHSGTIELAGDITPDQYLGWNGNSMELAIGTWVVILRTDEGHDVIYQEFAGGRADISVSQGQHVDAGDEIGYLDNGAFSGATENNNGLVTHLHLGICTGTWANAVANGGSFTESTWVNPRNIL